MDNGSTPVLLKATSFNSTQSLHFTKAVIYIGDCVLCYHLNTSIVSLFCLSTCTYRLKAVVQAVGMVPRLVIMWAVKVSGNVQLKQR